MHRIRWALHISFSSGYAEIQRASITRTPKCRCHENAGVRFGAELVQVSWDSRKTKVDPGGEFERALQGSFPLKPPRYSR